MRGRSVDGFTEANLVIDLMPVALSQRAGGRRRWFLSLTVEDWENVWLSTAQAVLRMVERPGLDEGKSVISRLNVPSYVGPDPTDARNLRALALNEAQSLARKGDLLRAAQLMTTAEFAVHSLSDGNGRTAHLLAYGLMHGFAHRDAPRHVAWLLEGAHHNGLGVAHPSMLKQAVEAACADRLSSFASLLAEEGAPKGSTGRLGPMSVHYISASSLSDTGSNQALLSTLLCDQYVPAGPGFALLMPFAASAGFIRKPGVVLSSPKMPVPLLNMDAVIENMRRLLLGVDLAEANRRLRRRTVEILIEEMARPERKLQGCSAVVPDVHPYADASDPPHRKAVYAESDGDAVVIRHRNCEAMPVETIADRAASLTSADRNIDTMHATWTPGL